MHGQFGNGKQDKFECSKNNNRPTPV